MDMKTTDRRVIRTRRLLGEALVDLSLEKGFDEVTIQDITKRADIGYRTFFRHYENKETLLYDVLEGILEEVLNLIVPKAEEIEEKNDFIMIPAKNITFLFEHAKENHILYKVLLSTSSGMGEKIMTFACKAASKNMTKIQNPKVPTDIAAYHIVSSLIAMIRWWLDQNMPYSPEEMGEIASNLILKPTMETLV
jgi:AcrR family transcriptional regulator